MKNLFAFLSAIVFSLSAFAHTGMEYTVKGNKAQHQLNEQEALKYYEQAIKLNPRNVEALSQASIMCANIGNRSTNNLTRDKYYKTALTYAQLALKLAPKNADANFAMAVYYGRKVYTVTYPKSRIALSAQIKKYAERTLQYQPNHFEAMTILGMWHYERATLTYAEQKIVAFLGGLPDGSLKEAKQYLRKSNAIAPNNITTHFALGKICKEEGNKKQCIIYWTKALKMKAQYQDDLAKKQDIKKRLANI